MTLVRLNSSPSIVITTPNDLAQIVFKKKGKKKTLVSQTPEHNWGKLQVQFEILRRFNKRVKQQRRYWFTYPHIETAISELSVLLT